MVRWPHKIKYSMQCGAQLLCASLRQLSRKSKRVLSAIHVEKHQDVNIERLRTYGHSEIATIQYMFLTAGWCASSFVGQATWLKQLDQMTCLQAKCPNLPRRIQTPETPTTLQIGSSRTRVELVGRCGSNRLPLSCGCFHRGTPCLCHSRC